MWSSDRNVMEDLQHGCAGATASRIWQSQTGQEADVLVEALLRRVTDADIRFDRGVPVFPQRPGAPVLRVEDVDRLANGDEA